MSLAVNNTSTCNELPSFSEFLSTNGRSKNQQRPKTRSQASRSRRKSTRTTRPTKKSQVTATATQASASAACEQPFVPITRRGVSKFSSSSEADFQSRQPVVVTHQMSGISVQDTRISTYAERMNDYIAQAVIENDRSRSPPTLSHVYSSSPIATTFEPRYFGKYDMGLENASKQHSNNTPSSNNAVRCMDAYTPCKGEVEICDSSPMAKRRLFADAACVASEANSGDCRIDAETVVGHLGHHNGYRSIQKFFSSSLNGKSLYPVEHYEDGLLAIANAACLMSTGVSDGHPSQTKVSEDHQAGDMSGSVSDKCGFTALLGYASSQLTNAVDGKLTSSSSFKPTDAALPRHFVMWRDHSREMV